MQTPWEAGRLGGSGLLRKARGAAEKGAPYACEAARASEKVPGRRVRGWRAPRGPWDFLTQLRGLGRPGKQPRHTHPSAHPVATLPVSSRTAQGGPGGRGRHWGGLRRARAAFPTLHRTPHAFQTSRAGHLPSSWSNTMVAGRPRSATAEDAEGRAARTPPPPPALFSPAPRGLRAPGAAAADGGGRTRSGSSAPRTRRDPEAGARCVCRAEVAGAARGAAGAAAARAGPEPQPPRARSFSAPAALAPAE